MSHGLRTKPQRFLSMRVFILTPGIIKNNFSAKCSVHLRSWKIHRFREGCVIQTSQFLLGFKAQNCSKVHTSSTLSSLHRVLSYAALVPLTSVCLSISGVFTAPLCNVGCTAQVYAEVLRSRENKDEKRKGGLTLYSQIWS